MGVSAPLATLSPTASMAGLRLSAFPTPPGHTLPGAAETSQLLCRLLPDMRRVSDRAGSLQGLRFTPCIVWPSVYYNNVGIPDSFYFAARWLACRFPLSTLRHAPRGAYLSAAATAIHAQAEASKSWFNQQKERLKAGDCAGVIESLRAHFEPDEVADSEAAVRSCYRYLSRRTSWIRQSRNSLASASVARLISCRNPM